jgi:MFS family permease
VGYLEILRARHATRLLVGTLVGRLPNATAAIAIVLFIRAEGGTYSLAGALAAVYGIANAVGQPLLGRLVDVHGQPRVQLPAAVLSALAMAVFAFGGTDPLPLAYVAVAAAGLFAPPLEGGLRALWPAVLRREDQVHTAYAMDAVAQEVMFTVGPLLVTVFVSLWSAPVALLVLNVIGVLGALSVVVSPPSRAWRSAPREAHWLGALRSPGLLALLGAFLFVGIALGSITVASVSYADGHGGDVVYGWLMAAIGLGALLGGHRLRGAAVERGARAATAGPGGAAGGVLPAVDAHAGRGRHGAADRARRGVPRAGPRLCLHHRRPARAQGHGHRGFLVACDDVHRGRVGRNGRRGAGRTGRWGPVGVRRAGGRGGRVVAGPAGHRAGPRSSRRGCGGCGFIGK